MNGLAVLKTDCNAVEWLGLSAEIGVPIVVPCSVHGEPRLACGVWTTKRPHQWWGSDLHAAATCKNDELRVWIALEACRRVYAFAASNGAVYRVP